ncbi:SDR family oxidoreductase [Amycolatopsis sp. OK19-0408]|uniref:SDR family oxidoreductase n=1 Tax=Amycolatopsis iheyensis TaxID=2945988 RepID=A0A9X2N4Z8_9PSEU|nr:SDR family oxidoreductase [Amycolatopsis iheyensis]MCR6482416.1 SDR family oxidoreductase [Amycolatopsis iheyensis]
MSLLDGRVVVITGAGRGLGRAFARHAADHGAAVVVNDVDAEPAHETAALVEAAGGTAVASVGSVADADYARGLITLCGNRFGRLDGLVNNAAVGYHARPWEDDDAERTRALVETNVLGPLHCGTAAAEVMVAQGNGVIVNVTSGSMIGQRGAAAYSASKGAVASMTYSWAADLAGRGVRVNAVSPIAWTRLMAADPRGNPDAHPPERVAPLVTYLLSDLSAGVTGQVLRLADGHLHAVRQPAIIRPVLHREVWTPEEIAAAVDGELVLESPPRARWTL